MEAARLPASRASAASRGRQFLSRYGLYFVLAALPVIFGIQDLTEDGNLVRLGQNVVAGINCGLKRPKQTLHAAIYDDHVIFLCVDVVSRA